MLELKPCPFCGGSPRIRYIKERGIPSGDDGFRAVVECVNTHECGCNLQKWALKQLWARETAIKAWNRRADNG